MAYHLGSCLAEYWPLVQVKMRETQEYSTPFRYQMTRYVHTLLFMCPKCTAPVAVSDVRPEMNLEIVDAKKYRIVCVQCDSQSEVLGIMAKARWVNEWPLAREGAAAAVRRS